MKISDIVRAIQTHGVRITDHAVEEAESDNLKFDEIYFSVENGEIIERYKDDKPYPSCLIFGRAFGCDAIHSVWAYNEKNKWAVCITVYRPDADRWNDNRKRRAEP